MKRTKRVVTRIVVVDEYEPEYTATFNNPPYSVYHKSDKPNTGDGEGLFVLGLFGTLMAIRKVARNREAKRLRAIRRQRDSARRIQDDHEDK